MYWIIMYVLEFLKLDLVLVKLMGYERKKWSYPFMVAFICVLIIVLFRKRFGLNDDHLLFVYGISAVIAIILSLKNNRKILIVILAYSIICVLDSILGGLYALVKGYNVNIILSNNILRVISNSISIVAFYLLYIIKRSIKVNRLHFHRDIISRRYIIIAFLGVLGIALYMAPVQVLGLMHNSQKVRFFTLLGISLSGLIVIIISIVLIVLSSNTRYYKERLKLNEELIEQQKQYYKMLIKKDNDTKKFRHDIKNHIYCIQKLCEAKKFGEVYKYAINIQEVVDNLKVDIQTGNDIVNVIAADILGRKMAEGIILKWKGILPNELKMNNMDLCIIFSNLFKNAVEATEKILEDSEKVIEVAIKYLDMALLIQIKNPIIEKVSIINNKLITSKRDKNNHGFGSLNVENVVNKYGGNIQYKSLDKSFLVEILLEDVIVNM